MKILFYSTKDFEQPYLEAANTRKEETTFIKEALSLQTADKAKGFEVISIFAGDDASSNTLEDASSPANMLIASKPFALSAVCNERASLINITSSLVPLAASM